MSESVVQLRRHAQRFFCHRCNVVFEDNNLQDCTCPCCSTGFIELLDRDSESIVSGTTDGEFSDADGRNVDDGSNAGDSVDGSVDDLTRQNRQRPPMLNDLAFLMAGGRPRGRPTGRRTDPSIMEPLMWLIGGRGGHGAVTAGAPFVIVGAPGDYMLGGEGLDSVVSQLLGQLENTGPPPLPREQINAIPSETITAEQVEANMSCSVCWDSFKLDESVSRLECEHIFHPGCITPWLQLHATCPVCRRALGTPSAAPSATQFTINSASDAPAYTRMVVRRVGRRRREPDASSSGSSVSPGSLWAQLASSIASASDSSPSSSLASASSDHYMDIDYD